MSLKQAIENLKYDARMIDINLKSEAITQPDLKKHLDKLPDLAGACAPVELDDTNDSDSLNGHGHN